MRNIRSKWMKTFVILIVLMNWCGFSTAQNQDTNDNAVVDSPQWEVGDTWVLEGQMYDKGTVDPSANGPHWGDGQRWRFEVEGLDSFKGRDHWVVAVYPVEGNTCPYNFKIWYRAGDKTISRTELIHPEGTLTKSQKVGLDRVVHDTRIAKKGPLLAGSAPAAPDKGPLLAGAFPALPIQLPVFNSNGLATTLITDENSPMKTVEPGRHRRIIQAVEEADAEAFQNKVAPAIRERRKNLRGKDGIKVVKIKHRSDAVAIDHQYWGKGLPWYIYGERLYNGEVQSRFRLIDTESD